MKTLEFKLVAEVKTKSPFGFRSDRSWDELLEIAVQYGDIVSIHIDPRWGGHPEDINKAFPLCSQHKKPILAKGLTWASSEVHEYLIRGADHVLVVDNVVQKRFEPGVCWYELPYTYDGLRGIDFQEEHVYVSNARNAGTGADLTTDYWPYIRRLHYGELVQASKVKTIYDVKPDAEYVIVGEHLPDFVKAL